MRLLLLLFPLLFGCDPDAPRECLAAENILAWQVRTNNNVATTSLPLDLCQRQTTLIGDLLAGGEISISRTVQIPAFYARPVVEIDSGAVAGCAHIALSLGALTSPGSLAAFVAGATAPLATIAATVDKRCSVTLRPRVSVSDAP